MSIIKIDSLEIFKQNRYYPTDIGLVSDNAYLSIVVTNKCQCNCAYCINSETDRPLDLPCDKALGNIRYLVEKYNIKEAILLGGEPLLHPNILGFISTLRLDTGLNMVRLTTNGIRLKDNEAFIKELVREDIGIQGINISFHNEDFITLKDLRRIYNTIKYYNPAIKVRVNANIWRGNLDTINSLTDHIRKISFVDEIRISNIIPKDSFSVNTKNNGTHLILSDKQYISLFTSLIESYKDSYTIIDNKDTLGFVRYLLIPAKCPIIINWNLGSKVSDQVCEDDIMNRKINTFKCLVSGDISLSWNESNTLDL